MRLMRLTQFPKLNYASSEAANTLASNVTFAGMNYTCVMLTSCSVGEGKSYVAMHLAKALSNMGYSCVLVDADIRKSVFVSRYGAEVKGELLGLTHFLAGKAPLDAVLYQVESTQMAVIPAGKAVVNSLPLLTSSAFSELILNLKKSYQFIIVDAPPIGLVIDAAMIATACDATIFVTENNCSRKELNGCIKQIKQANVPILGVVLNKVKMDRSKSRKYYYRSQYMQYQNYYSDRSDDETSA